MLLFKRKFLKANMGPFHSYLMGQKLIKKLCKSQGILVNYVSHLHSKRQLKVFYYFKRKWGPMKDRCLIPSAFICTTMGITD